MDGQERVSETEVGEQGHRHKQLSEELKNACLAVVWAYRQCMTQRQPGSQRCNVSLNEIIHE